MNNQQDDKAVEDLRKQLGLSDRPVVAAGPLHPASMQEAWEQRRRQIEDEERALASMGADYAGNEGWRRLIRKASRGERG